MTIFDIIRNKIIVSKNITSVEKEILNYILSLPYPHYKSFDGIADALNIGRSTVYRALKSLRRKRVIAWVDDGNDRKFIFEAPEKWQLTNSDKIELSRIISLSFQGVK